MRWGSIESRHGVDEPDYTAPSDPELRAPRTGHHIDALWSLLVPLFGVVIGLKYLFRDEVGPGLACLLVAALGAVAWSFALGQVT